MVEHALRCWLEWQQVLVCSVGEALCMEGGRWMKGGSSVVVRVMHWLLCGSVRVVVCGSTLVVVWYCEMATSAACM
jgi:hypothetical protein